MKKKVKEGEEETPEKPAEKPAGKPAPPPLPEKEVKPCLEKKPPREKNLTCPRCGTVWDRIKQAWTSPEPPPEKPPEATENKGFMGGFFRR
jgi:hypothetical protein